MDCIFILLCYERMFRWMDWKKKYGPKEISYECNQIESFVLWIFDFLLFSLVFKYDKSLHDKRHNPNHGGR
ncbi:MAG: hypothetical protein ACLFSQ_13170 [Candidatus Zixiibacteriota bacterium]